MPANAKMLYIEEIDESSDDDNQYIQEEFGNVIDDWKESGDYE